jgi:phage tail-like protein
MRSDEIALLLPGIFQRVLPAAGGPSWGPLPALLSVMEALHAGTEETLADYQAICDPNRTLDTFVPYLASWVDLDRIFVSSYEPVNGAPPDPLGTGLGRLRQLVARSAELTKIRGTREGLLEFMRTATGLDGFEIDEPTGAAGERPFHIGVRAPRAAKPHALLLGRIVEVERPAYCTWELTFDAPAAASR